MTDTNEDADRLLPVLAALLAFWGAAVGVGWMLNGGVTV